ncbi:glycosyltransferase [Salinibacter altiplanensis]|uniref:glycosyltransferase n=1 Tax=Salinibacter altiplanensis TaxID=1803181 RepID=UPI00131A5216|nr:glycosyltransferase [Salinibacter altiplanensis]
MDVQFYTLAPSPHLVGVLNALSRHPEVDLHVAYEKKWLGERSWGLHPGTAPHTYLGSWDVTGKGQHVSPRLRSMIQEGAPDLAVVNTSYVSPNTYALISLLQRRKVPFIFWAERVSRISSIWVQWLRRPFLQWVLRRASGFVGPTRDTIRFYRSACDYDGPATWVPYHRDLDPFLEVSRPEASSGRLCFLVLGSLTHGKGIDTVLRALAQVERPAEMLVVGDGPRRYALEEMAAACRPRHRVTFRGTIPYEQVPGVMEEADVLLFPSRHDGFGMVTMEAFAAARPVAASKAVMSAREYIRPGENGWLLPVDDVSAWARRMEAILETEDSLPEWGRAARATIQSDYCVEEDVDRLVRFLQKELGAANNPTVAHASQA